MGIYFKMVNLMGEKPIETVLRDDLLTAKFKNGIVLQGKETPEGYEIKLVMGEDNNGKEQKGTKL